MSIAILTDLGLRVCGDFGTSADGFEILIGSHSPPPLVAGFGPSRMSYAVVVASAVTFAKVVVDAA